MQYETLDGEEMMTNDHDRGMDRELKVGIYFCIFAFALATVIYLLC